MPNKSDSQKDQSSTRDLQFVVNVLFCAFGLAIAIFTYHTKDLLRSFGSGVTFLLGFVILNTALRFLPRGRKFPAHSCKTLLRSLTVV